mgnify:CR=1 FL=1
MAALAFYVVYSCLYVCAALLHGGLVGSVTAAIGGATAFVCGRQGAGACSFRCFCAALLFVAGMRAVGPSVAYLLCLYVHIKGNGVAQLYGCTIEK